MANRYVVSDIPVEDLSDKDVLREANELRYHLRVTEGDISTRKTWAQADQNQEDPEFLVWLARVRGFHAHLTRRYLELRVRERQINRDLRQRSREASNQRKD